MAQRKIVVELDVSADFNADEFFEKLCDNQTDNYPPEQWIESRMSDSLYPGSVVYTHEDSC